MPTAKTGRSRLRLVALTPSAPLKTLDPATLDPVAAAAVEALKREGESANTQASYRSALRYWVAWYQLRYGGPIALPVPEAVVLQFIVDHVARATPTGLIHELPPAIDAALVEAGFKGKLGAPALNTVRHRLAVLSKAHTLRGVADPCRAAAVRELLTGTRKAYAQRGALPQPKAALTRDPLEALLATCDDSLRGLRDRALLLFAWSSGGRRRSEVTAATLENTRKVGDRQWSYLLTHSKANQSGADRPENRKPIVGAAAEALEAWLAASGITSGALFRRIRSGNTVAEPLSAQSVRSIVKARCVLAGLDGDFSAHSLRSGFLTEAARQNVPLGETMALSGHATVANAMKYYRPGEAIASRAASLYDNVRVPTATDPTAPFVVDKTPP